MSQHPNARLTPRGRALLCERVGGGMRVSDAAAMAGVSRQTAHKWLARARRGEPMADRGCRPRRLARLTPPEVEARVADAPGRRRPRHRRAAFPRPRHARALRARAPRGAAPRRRKEGAAHTRGGAGTGPSGAAAGRGGAPGRRACTWPSTTTAGSPTPSSCPTRGRRRPAPSWGGRSRSTRASGSSWSA